MLAAAERRLCSQCGTDVAVPLLACPACHRLVHASELTTLAERAESAERDGRTADAIEAWQAAVLLLPASSAQRATILSHLGTLASAETAAALPARPRKQVWTLASVAALFVWKIKFILVFVLTKGKLLLLGLTKGGTVLSMLASMGVYWTAWGLWFAVAFIASVYVHEIGHVAALRRYGIPASPPMFIPGFGAFVSVAAMSPDPRQRARVGLAGPLWGLGAAVAAGVVYAFTGNPFWAAVARIGAWINIFNLTPFGPLDGGKAFAALSTSQRWGLAGGIGALWLATGESLLLLVLAVAVVRALVERSDHEDQGALISYLAIIISLATVTHLLPGPLTP